MNIDTIKKIVRKESDISLVGTCCILSKNVAITSKHVVKNKDNLFIQISDDNHIKFTSICDENYDIAILRLDEDVKFTQYYKLDISNILKDDKWKTFGFPERREFQGANMSGVVEFPDTIEDTIYDIELKITSNNQLQSYRGLSGSPVIIGDTIKAILKIKPDGEFLGGVKICKCKKLLQLENICFMENYSEWIQKLNLKIPNDEEGFKIDRKSTYKNLIEFILKGSGLVIGDAGIGKSHMLKNIAKDLNSNNTSTIYIAIDDFINADRDELEKELLLDGECLIEKIKKEKNRLNTPDKKLIIIFDSFDSARNEEVKQRFMRLAKEIHTELHDMCNIIISSRIYDAKKSIQLQELFTKDKVICKDEIKCRHFKIENLNKLEVINAIEQICGDSNIYNILSNNLKEILTIPFYLWIFENIYNQKFTLESMNNIDSDVELLDLFCKQKLHGEFSDSSEYLINIITEKMILKKTLSVNKNEIFNPQIQEIWNHLFSNSILKSTDIYKNKTSFYHNILFDYFVSRFILVNKIDCITSFIEEDISRVIFLRPSFMYFFIKIWSEERNKFWECVFNIAKSDKLPTISLFIPINIIITKSKSIDDLFFLVEKCNIDDYFGIEITKRILQGISTFGFTDNNVWINFLDEISKNLKYDHIGLISWNVLNIINKSTKKDSLQMCNNIAINIYRYIDICNLYKGDNWLRRIQSNYLVAIICKSYYTNIDESKKIILSILEKNDSEGEYVEYIRVLVNNIKYIYEVDYELTEKIFINIYSNHVNNDSVTNMDVSNILSLTSNRRQDYNMCKFILHQNLDDFINKNTKQGLKLAISILNILALNECRSNEYNKINLKFKGKNISILEDNSHIWSNCYWSEEIKNFTDSIFKYFDIIIENRNEEKIEEFINTIIDYGKSSFIWAQLLSKSSKYPSVLKDKLFDVYTSQQMMTCRDIIYELTIFIESCSEIFSEDEINCIKYNVYKLGLNVSKEKYSREYIEDCQMRILMAIRQRLQNEEVIDKAKISQGDYKNKPLISFTSQMSELSYEDILNSSGIKIDKSNYIYKLLEKSNNITMDNTKVKLTLEEKSELLSLSKEIFEVLQKEGNSLELEKELYNKFAKVIKNLVILSNQIYTEEEYIYYKEKCLHIIKLEIFNEIDANFNGINSAYSSTAKHIIAEILPILYTFKNDSDIIVGIDTLLEHESLSIRYICISNLYKIYKIESKYVLDKLKYIISINNDCLNQSVIILLRGLVKDYENDVVNIIKFAYNEKKYNFINESIDIVLYLYFLKGHVYFKNIIDKIIEEPWNYNWQGYNSILVIYEWIDYEILDFIDKDVVKNIIDFINQIMNRLVEKIIDADKDIVASSLSKELKTSESEAYKIIDSIINQLYFKSGALNDEDISKNKQLENKYYINIKPILINLVRLINKNSCVFIFASAIHNMIKMLEYLLEYDTCFIIKIISVILSNTKQSGYVNDRMAIEEIVKIIDIVLADHKILIQDEEVMKDIVIILDCFADTGNSEALNLIWKLDAIYR